MKRLVFDPKRQAVYTEDGERIVGVVEFNITYSKGGVGRLPEVVAELTIRNMEIREIDPSPTPDQIALAAKSTQKIQDDLTGS